MLLSFFKQMTEHAVQLLNLWVFLVIDLLHLLRFPMLSFIPIHFIQNFFNVL